MSGGEPFVMSASLETCKLPFPLIILIKKSNSGSVDLQMKMKLFAASMIYNYRSANVGLLNHVSTADRRQKSNE